MDYVTIHVNKKFLYILLALTVLFADNYFLYKYAWNKGAMAALQFDLEQQKRADNNGESNSSQYYHKNSDKESFFHHPELENEPGVYPYLESRRI